MDKFTFDYSMKNIAVPKNSEYIKRLIEKVEDFTKRLRWRAHFYLNPESKSKNKETYGFKSAKAPPFMQQLKNFENGMLQLIEEVKFRKINSPLQNKLKRDLKKIESENNILVPADKTNNYYSVTKQQYNTLMKENVTATYKKSTKQSEQTINVDAKKITDNLELSDRVQVLAPKSAYITLKDHKENFRNNPTCRLINPSKSEIGIISKRILDRINTDVLKETKANQWKNSTTVINWFKNTETRENSTFINFDVVNFYPTIDKDLLQKSIDFAMRYTNITTSEREIIFHAKDTLLFHDNNPWQKSNTDDLFDVTMGSYDGAETCELVGSYILNEISTIIPKANIGLYRDDGLAIIHKPPRAAENLKKKLCEKFHQLRLRITANTNATVVDFLDITFDLSKKEYRPYSKPGNTLLYVHTESNHPSNITKRIPISIQTRLSNISSNEEVFNSAKPEYEKALREAGHKVNLKYEPKENNTNKEKQTQRKRKITWFNPPYSRHVKTNIGKKFLTLIDQHFPKDHPLHKICNRNTIKISYSCMDNMENATKAHNNKIINHDMNQATTTCNCRNKRNCPLNGKCMTSNIIYEAKVTTPNLEKTYIGLTATSFKARHANHSASFNHRAKRHQTELSNYIWTLKDESTPYTITWKIVKHAQPYSPKTKRCNLCLWEKYNIITAKKTILNSKTEIISTCRHKKKFLLSNMDRPHAASL